MSRIVSPFRVGSMLTAAKARLHILLMTGVLNRAWKLSALLVMAVRSR